jgi:hypothetical protein
MATDLPVWRRRSFIVGAGAGVRVLRRDEIYGLFYGSFGSFGVLVHHGA